MHSALDAAEAVIEVVADALARLAPRMSPARMPRMPARTQRMALRKPSLQALGELAGVEASVLWLISLVGV